MLFENSRKWGLRGGIFLLHAISTSLLSVQSLGAETVIHDFQITGAQPLQLPGESPSKKLVVAELPEYATTVLYQKEGIVTPNMTAVIVLFGGVGGDVAKTGIRRSMSPISSSLAKLGIGTIAFENPLYFQNQLPEAERRKIIERFSTAEAQMKWIYDCLKVVNWQLREYENKTKKPAPKLIVSGRSFGARLLAEAALRFQDGDPQSEVFSAVQRMLLMGIFGKDLEAVREWRENKAKLLISSPSMTSVDLLATEGYEQVVDQLILERERRGISQPRAMLPDTIAIVAAQDEFLSVSRQLATLDKLRTEAGGQLNLRVQILDTRHDPTSSLKWEMPSGEQISAATMERMKPIIQAIASEEVIRSSGTVVHISPYAPVACKEDLIALSTAFEKKGNREEVAVLQGQ